MCTVLAGDTQEHNAFRVASLYGILQLVFLFHFAGVSGHHMLNLCEAYGTVFWVLLFLSVLSFAFLGSAGPQSLSPTH